MFGKFFEILLYRGMSKKTKGSDVEIIIKFSVSLARIKMQI